MQVRPPPPSPLGASARWAAGTSEFLGGPDDMPSNELPSDVPTSTPRQAVPPSLLSGLIPGPISGVIPLHQ